MSRRNGDRARFQKNRKRQVKLRARIRALAAGLGAKPIGVAAGAIDRDLTASSKDAA